MHFEWFGEYKISWTLTLFSASFLITDERERTVRKYRLHAWKVIRENIPFQTDRSTPEIAFAYSNIYPKTTQTSKDNHLSAKHFQSSNWAVSRYQICIRISSFTFYATLHFIVPHFISAFPQFSYFIEDECFLISLTITCLACLDVSNAPHN